MSASGARKIRPACLKVNKLLADQGAVKSNEGDEGFDMNPPISPSLTAKSSASIALKLRPGTECVYLESSTNDPYNASSVPIYQTATFKQPSINDMGEYDYSRSGNPTRTQLGTWI